MMSSLINSGHVTMYEKRVDRHAPQTIIVTGLGRSGTSMVAETLLKMGLFLGDHLYDQVFEDAFAVDAIKNMQTTGIDRFLQQRNRNHLVWGFKLPNLHFYISQAQLAKFRSPRLIVTLRDPLAIASRSAISDHVEISAALRDASLAQAALVEFIQICKIPTLLISYEKAIYDTAGYVSVLSDFVNLGSAYNREAVVRAVTPNKVEYMKAATRVYNGLVDGFLDGKLFGWCCDSGTTEPVSVEVLLDEEVVSSVLACTFRDDLLRAGIGNGLHGFFVELPADLLERNPRVHVRVAGTTYELQESGNSADQYRRLTS